MRVAYSTSPRSTNIPSIVITSDRTGGELRTSQAEAASGAKEQTQKAYFDT